MVPLIVRSHFSLMWGTASVSGLCRAARRLGYDRLALTDTDNLYGLWPFLKACSREGLTPIVGAEITDKGSGRRAACLVESREGFSNLCRLITRRHMDEAFDLEKALPDLARGLIVLTGSPALLESWHGRGARVAAALPRHPLSQGHPLCRAARRLGVPLAAVPGSFFLDPEEARTHRVLRAMDKNTSISRLAQGEAAPDGAWLASPAEYGRRFAVCPEAVLATHQIAERLSFSGPEYGLVMPPWTDSNGRDSCLALREAAYAGARRRYGDDLSETVVERMEHELSVIQGMGFCSYFLVVAGIVAHSPRTCGRGSGAASLVSYCLGITNVCPIKHNLYFERFLNPGRKDPPDLDVDFAWDERDAILDAVLSRHAGQSAMVASLVLFQPRMAIREAARVYGLPDAEISRVTKKLPWFWRAETAGEDLLETIRKRPESRGLSFPEPWPEIISCAQRILGAPRCISVHPGGVVITPGDVDAYAPVQRAPKGVPVLQWDKDSVEDAGLVKIDLLGNRSLGVIRDALKNLEANGVCQDELCWEPEEDYATQQAVARGETMGCFYIESPAMRLLQKKAGVGDFEHLVIHSSITRPAANEWIREYVRRLHGGAWEPIHPLLADVLDETFGIMVYQEDVSRAAVSLAGFSHAEADALRKVMSKKDREHALADHRERFFAGAGSRGVDPAAVSKVWDMILSFSGYSFCKPHSASYARVSFQAAHLKVHHPAEFMAAVISNQGGFYSTFAYVSEARRMGLVVLGPCVNASNAAWKGSGKELRVGLVSVKGLSERTMGRVTAQREEGPFVDVADFVARVSPEENECLALVHCGALDALSRSGSRTALLWEVLACRGKSRGPALFGAMPPGTGPPPLAPENTRDRLLREFETLGFLCGMHPMELFRDQARKEGAIPARDLGLHVGRSVRVAGWLITGKVVSTKHGEPMEFLTFEDETGIFEATFFPETYRASCHFLDHGRPYLLWGRVEPDWGALTLTVSRARAMDAPPDETRVTERRWQTGPRFVPCGSGWRPGPTSPRATRT